MDHGTGLMATAATLAAYFRKKRTSMGQHVDVAAREVATSFIGDALLQQAKHLVARATTHRRWRHTMFTLARDAMHGCQFAVATGKEWIGLVNAVGRPDWLSAPRFADAQSRRQHRHELDREISARTCKRSREDVTRLLQSNGVAAFPSYNARDIVEDAHLNNRGTIRSLSSPEGESRKVVGVPWRFCRTPGKLETWTPKLGEHNEYVFGELLGLGRGEIDTLVQEKVIY